MAFVGRRMEGGSGVVDGVDCVLPSVEKGTSVREVIYSSEVYSLLREVLSNPVGVLFLHSSHHDDLVADFP